MRGVLWPGGGRPGNLLVSLNVVPGDAAPHATAHTSYVEVTAPAGTKVRHDRDLDL